MYSSTIGRDPGRSWAVFALPDLRLNTFRTELSQFKRNEIKSVQYMQTGVILDVVPCINPGWLAYMDIQQQVSDSSKIVDDNGNPSISTRVVSIQMAVQSRPDCIV